MDINIFSERLQKSMDIKKISLTHLCASTGMTQYVISGFLSGRIVPQNEQIAKIAKVLDVDPVYLAGLDDIPQKLNKQDEIENLKEEIRFQKDVIERLRISESFHRNQSLEYLKQRNEARRCIQKLTQSDIRSAK